MDLNKIGLLIGVFALLLAVPLAVSANLLTPKVQSWYSTTSLNRLNRRLLKLNERLKKSESSWTFTPAEWKLYREGQLRNQATLLVSFGLYNFVILTMAYVGIVQIRSIELAVGHSLPPAGLFHVLPRELKIVLVLAGLLSSLGPFSIGFFLRRGISELRACCYLHTDEGRNNLRAEIEKLTTIKSKYDSVDVKN